MHAANEARRLSEESAAAAHREDEELAAHFEDRHSEEILAAAHREDEERRTEHAPLGVYGATLCRKIDDLQQKDAAPPKAPPTRGTNTEQAAPSKKREMPSSSEGRAVAARTEVNMETRLLKVKADDMDIDNLPHGKGLLLKTSGEAWIVDGPFGAIKIRGLLGCNRLEMFPCTIGELAGKFEVWLNEEGMNDDEWNEKASQKLKSQVFGGRLYGNVLVTHSYFSPSGGDQL